MGQDRRSMTLLDVMMLVVGVGVGLAIVGRQEVVTSTGFLALVPYRFEVLADRLVGWIWVGAVAMSSVAMGRVVRRGQGPTRAEWLIIVTTICYAVGSDRIWLSEWASYRVWGGMDENRVYTRELTATCGAAGMIAIAILVILRGCRRVLPAWTTTLGLCVSIGSYPGGRPICWRGMALPGSRRGRGSTILACRAFLPGRSRPGSPSYPPV